jgi:arylsulfatase
MKKPHVVIMLAEQHRGDALSCAGHSIVKTPSLDRLAAGGARFSNAYTTSPVCMPARSSLQSGLYPHNLGQWANHDRLEPRFDNMANVLSGLGYHTAYLGKSHLYVQRVGGHMREHEPFMHELGWKDVRETTGPGGTVETESIVTDRWKELGVLETHREDYHKRKEGGTYRSTWPSPLPEGEHLDDFIGRMAVEYIEKYDRDEPLLAVVGFGAVHEPWDPPEKWAAMYDPADMDEPAPRTNPGEWVPEKAAEHHRTLQAGRDDIGPEQVANLRAAYYAKVSHMDHWVGRITDALEARGMLEDTLVVYLADHGEMLGDKGRVSKSVYYEPAVRVPLIVRYPRAGGAGQVCDRPTSIVDVFPTLVDAAGGDAEHAGFGRFLLPLLEDPAADHHDAVFGEYRTRTMIRDRRYKMVVDDTGTVLKLYDLREDPGEELNLVGKLGAETEIRRLRDRLLTWFLATQVRPVRSK